MPIFSKAELDLIGVPDWIDASVSLSSFENFISIFDYEPHRGHYGFSCNNDSGYSNIDNTTKFLSEVVHNATLLGFKCVLKPKRKISLDKRFGEYKDTIQRLSKSVDGFFVINESISARKVIEKSKATIHMPFTSTAVIAKNLGIPACFYDPVGLIDPNDPASNKIQVLNSPENLRMWLMKLL